MTQCRRKTVFIQVHRILLCVLVEKETSQLNTLLHSQNYTEALKVMLDTVGDLVMALKHRQNLRIRPTEDFLLAPTYHDNIRKSDISVTKEALFAPINQYNYRYQNFYKWFSFYLLVFWYFSKLA